MINSFSGRWVFLSNFYPVEIEHQGIKYPTVEHYYVAMKVKGDQMIDGRFYPQPDVREMISMIKTPGDAKRFGRNKIRLRKDWNDVKLEVMNWTIREKFKDPKLKEMLLSTEGEELVDGTNWHDVFWGVCSCPKCNGSGENNLGKILMKVRDELTTKEEKPSLEDILFPKN
jgi:ribA/ribD-fused uncharacterized protein